MEPVLVEIFWGSIRGEDTCDVVVEEGLKKSFEDECVPYMNNLELIKAKHVHFIAEQVSNLLRDIFCVLSLHVNLMLHLMDLNHKLIVVQSQLPFDWQAIIEGVHEECLSRAWVAI